MSARRALAVSALSLLVPASLLLVTATGSATEASGEPAARQSARRNAEQMVHLVALPQIVQPGGRVASPDDAKAAFTATFEPIAAGRKVRLQVRRASSWQTVATVQQDRRGRAQFARDRTKPG